VNNLLAFTLLIGVLSPTPLLAVQPDEMLANPKQEARVRFVARTALRGVANRHFQFQR
jgi:hypothetical protein